jgi:hypothetical protein
MPPRRDMVNLLRMLRGEGSRPSQKIEALDSITRLCSAQDPATLAAFVAAGGIPTLVQLLSPDINDQKWSASQHSMSAAQYGAVHTAAAGALMSLAQNAEHAVTIAASGAIPLLVQVCVCGWVPPSFHFPTDRTLPEMHWKWCARRI